MKRKQVLIAILVALGSLLTVLVAILINFATSTIPFIVQPYLPFTWPLVGVVALAGVIVAIALYRLQAVDEGPAPTPQGNYRQRMLAKVREFWINGVLEKSLHGTALMALWLQEQPEAVKDSLGLAFRQTQQPAQPLPPGTSITQVYDVSGGELLILGEPGAGKTTLLLELAQNQLERAGHDEQHPIPVVFNLSSWAIKQQPLAEWLIEELHDKYRVPQKISRSWVETDQILPLLDGLDEVAEKTRAACVDAINNYRQEHGLLPTVVCSRSSEYNDLMETKHRLQLRSAVVIQPLTAQQIDDYLSHAGQQLEAVREVLDEDRELQELVTTPFMLSILAVAYYGKSIVDLTTGPLQIRREDVFATYVQRMLQRRGTDARYTPQQAIHWLAWLAKRMQEQSIILFDIGMESITWLPDRQSRQIYYGMFLAWITVSIGGLMAVLIYGLATGLIRGLLILPAILLAAFLIFAIMSSALTNFISEGFGLLIASSFTFEDISSLASTKKGLTPATPAMKERMGIAFDRMDPFTKIMFVLSLFIVFSPAMILSLVPALLLRSTLGNRISTRLADLTGSLTGIFLRKVHFFNFPNIIKHWIFWYSRATPWNYQRFLDYATERMLLRKVGGGYIFIHRLLLDYFATLESISTSKGERKLNGR